MSQSSVQGSVTLRKLRTGATVQVSLSSSMQLFQLWSDNAGTVSYAPDWSGVNTHPTVKVNLSSSTGETFNISSVVWYINNSLATNIPNVTAGTGADGKPYLEINTNLAQQSILNFSSGTLTAEVSFTDQSGNHYQVTKSEIIRVQKAVADGYYVFIDASTTEVNETTSATLTASLRQGLSPMPDSSVVFKWFTSTLQAETDPGVQTGKTLVVTADMVNGSQLFICRAYAGGSEVDAESIMITDSSDPLRIAASVQQYKNNSAAGIPGQNNVTSVDVASDNDKTTVTFRIVQSDGSAFSGTADWQAVKRHAGTAKLIKAVSGADYTADYTAAQETTTAVTDGYSVKSSSGTASISIDVLDADFYTPDSGGSGTVVKDEVVTTATASDITPSAS